MYLPETSPFLSAQIALVSTFFQMFIVLGMYNFGGTTNWEVYLKYIWLADVDVFKIVHSEK